MNFAVIVGHAAILSVLVRDDCGNNVSPADSQGAQVTAYLSDGVTIRMADAGNGIWRHSWIPTGASTSLQIGVEAFAVVEGLFVRGSLALTGAVTQRVAAPAPATPGAPAAVIAVSQSALSFTAVAQGGTPLPQTFGVLNTGQGSMDWTAQASTLSGGNWLQLSPTSGTVQAPYVSVSLVSVSVNSSVLAAGTYYCRITVASPEATNSPQLLTVIFTVLPANFGLGPQIYPTGLIFVGAAGMTPSSQDVVIANPSGDTNSYQSAVEFTNAISISPTNAALPPGQPVTVHIYPNFSGLAPGSVIHGAITLQFADQSPFQTVNILMVVAPSGSTALCSPQPLQVQYQPFQHGASVGQPTAINAQVSDGCGNPVNNTAGQNADVTALFSDGSSVTLNNIGNGTWQGTWTPTIAGTFSTYVAAIAQQGTAVAGGESASMTVVVAPAPPGGTPVIAAIVQGASFVAGPIAPGELISIFGTNLATCVSQLPGFPEMCGTTLSLGNETLPVTFASPTQLNLQVPYSVPPNTQYQLSVQNGTTLSVPQTVVIAAAVPGIFTLNQTGKGQGIIVKSDGVTLAQSATPAYPGEEVVIYCTGLGPVNGVVAAGTQPTAATTVNTVTATIGGQSATVLYSGLTAGFPGLYQVNAFVPPGVAPGNAVPVTLSVSGLTSAAVTLAVE